MAEREYSLFCLFFIISFPTVLSRNLLSSSKTTVLDVSASIHKTLNFDTNSINTFNQKEETSYSSSASLTLQLHSRSSIHKHAHNDYNSLTLARLERDSVRVKSLQTRLDLAINGITRSDLNPVYTELGAEELEVPVISGTSQGSGEYFSRLGIGHPPSQVYMVLDTGSDVNWIQCAPIAISKLTPSSIRPCPPLTRLSPAILNSVSH